MNTRPIGQKQYTDTDAIRGDGEGQNSRKEKNRRAENGREQTEADGDGWRMFKNNFYVTQKKKCIFSIIVMN